MACIPIVNQPSAIAVSVTSTFDDVGGHYDGRLLGNRKCLFFWFHSHCSL